MKLYHVITVFCAAAVSGLAAPKQSNILLILADNLGYGDLGYTS